MKRTEEESTDCRWIDLSQYIKNVKDSKNEWNLSLFSILLINIIY